MEDESDFLEGNEEESEAEEGLDPDNPEDYFAIIESEFNRTLILLEQSPESAQYAGDYTKLFEAFYQAFTKQKELEGVTTEQKEDISTKDNKLELAMKLADEDKKTIDDLKDQIQHAWRLADEAHAREQLAQEIIDNLRRQVENLNKEIEFNRKMMSQDTEEEVELSKHKDGLERERDKLVNEVNQLTTKLVNALSYQEELERKNSEADLRMNEIAGQLEDSGGEINRQKRTIEKLESDIAEHKSKLDDKDKNIIDLNTAIDTNTKQMEYYEQEVREYRNVYEKASRELEQLTTKHAKLQDDYNNALFEKENIKLSLNEKNMECKNLLDQTSKLKLDNTKLMKIRVVLEKKVGGVQHEKDEVIEDRNNLRVRLMTMERQIEENKKFYDEDKRTIETLTKEKDVLNKTLQRQQGIHRDLNKLIQIQEQSRKKLEMELDFIFVENSKQKKMIGQLERDRDRLAEEQLDLSRTIEEHVEDVRVKKAHIVELKRNITDQEYNVRQQHNLYEIMRSERNALQKNLQESNAECEELRKKLKIVMHQTEQLKEDISAKEKLLVKDENIMRKITKEKENLKIELMSCLDQIRVLKGDLKELKDEEKRLHKTIMQNEKTIRDQSKDLEQLMNERDVLGSQLVRRNDEIALLNEKIRILQTTLARGETQYDQRLDDIKLLKLEVKRLRQEKALMTKNMSNMVDLRQEIFHLERDLTKSRLKCKALEQEAQHPLNIHRWRKLEGSDPELMELLQKLQIQQKRLLHQASEAVERERHLKEAQHLYLNLRGVLAKQPGPAVQEQLLKTQRALKIRGDKLKAKFSVRIKHGRVESSRVQVRSAEGYRRISRIEKEIPGGEKGASNAAHGRRIKQGVEPQPQPRGRKRSEIYWWRFSNVSATNIYEIAPVKGPWSTRELPSVYSPLLIGLMKMSKVLEVCVDSIESAENAITGGADRLELCSSLVEGGLTPTPGLLIQIQNMNSRNIPVYCLLRCRPGNFIYKLEEIEIMKEDARILRKHGADGFVFGALTENGEVNMKFCREIIKVCHPLPVTFHRAFDFCKRPTIEVEVIIDLGFQRILTSGKQNTAQMGVKLIKKLIEQVGNRIAIMPGGGVNKDNVKYVVDNTGVGEIHGSFKMVKEETPSETKSDDESEITIGGGPLYVTDENAVAEIVNILKTV